MALVAECSKLSAANPLALAITEVGNRASAVSFRVFICLSYEQICKSRTNTPALKLQNEAVRPQEVGKDVAKGLCEATLRGAFKPHSLYCNKLANVTARLAY